jgi:RNA polymerase sigma-70 factor (ECF subfamily)
VETASDLGPPARGAGRLDETDLLTALRAGDERRFAELVTAYTPALLRVAESYLPSRALAEDVVQETWLAVLGGLDRFEGRSSLRTWIFGILMNVARARARRERRSVPFSAAFGAQEGPTVDPDRFRPLDAPELPGGWITPPRRYEIPESALLSSEVRRQLRGAIDALPPRQRSVLTLRDIDGLDVAAVSNLLDITPGNQRVLLHRARARMRQTLEDYLDDGGADEISGRDGVPA